MTEHEIGAHLDRFLDMLDARFRQYGAPGGLPESLRLAVRAIPRHRFVHRYGFGGCAVHDADAALEAHLPTIYSDTVLSHVDAAGNPLRSSNSQPSYVLWLLAMLTIRPGQNVLEIGSGSGWLIAIMSRLVGETGSVTGIEILADLAESSRRDHAGLGIANAAILTGDGGDGIAGGPFDRVMVTAATWDVTDGMLSSVARGGLLLVPLLTGWGDECHVTLLRRAGDALVAEGGVPGYFVPLVGPGQMRERHAEVGNRAFGTVFGSSDSPSDGVAILRAGAAPEPSADLLVEHRGESVLVRRLASRSHD